MNPETQAKIDAAAVKLAEAADAAREAYAAWKADFDAGRVTGHFGFPDAFPLGLNPNHPYAVEDEFRRLARIGFVSPGVIPGI